MKKTKLISTFAIAVLLIVAGILTIIYNDLFLKVVVICAGIIAVYSGLRSLFEIKKFQFQGKTKTITLVRNIITVVVGFVSVFSPLFAAEAVFTAVMYILATSLVFSAVVEIENGIVIRKTTLEIPVKDFFVEAGINLLIAAILFTSSQAILSAAVKVVGGIFIGLGSCLILWAVRLDKMLREDSCAKD